jgi:hypothetical protein
MTQDPDDVISSINFHLAGEFSGRLDMHAGGYSSAHIFEGVSDLKKVRLALVEAGYVGLDGDDYTLILPPIKGTTTPGGA